MDEDHAERARHHAETIMRAAGSSLANYEMPKNRAAILSATLDCWEEAYRAGAAFVLSRMSHDAPASDPVEHGEAA